MRPSKHLNVTRKHFYRLMKYEKYLFKCFFLENGLLKGYIFSKVKLNVTFICPLRPNLCQCGPKRVAHLWLIQFEIDCDFNNGLPLMFYLSFLVGEEFPRKESLSPPPPSRMTWDEYINSAECPLLGRPLVSLSSTLLLLLYVYYPKTVSFL